MINITINGNARQFDETEFTVGPFTIGHLVTKLGLTGKRLAIERNGEIVPKSLFAETLLVSGDKLEIVGAVGGG